MADTHDVTAVTPDADHAPGTPGERGTSALPEGHRGRRGLDAEKIGDGTAEKYPEDTVIDGITARHPE